MKQQLEVEVVVEWSLRQVHTLQEHYNCKMILNKNNYLNNDIPMHKYYLEDLFEYFHNKFRSIVHLCSSFHKVLLKQCFHKGCNH
jgi:hypothetical protein